MNRHHDDFLGVDDQRLLLRIARDTLDSWVTHRVRISLDEYDLVPRLLEPHGAFVTLRRCGELRGCIGTMVNRNPLALNVADNTINASSRDPRFEPVSAHELSEIQIEISALTPGEQPGSPFIAVRDISEIIVGRDGLFIERPPLRGGLLLPQVASERNWSVEQFLRAVCAKAGYPEYAWELADSKLYRFTAQVFSEADLPSPRVSA